MNQEFIARNIARSIEKNPGLEILPPGSLSPEETATSMIGLLKNVYVQHGITRRENQVIDDIRSGNLQTWLAKKDDRFIATASLVRQNNGDVEIGRAVSLEKGNGKILMLLASLAHVEHDKHSPLVAEVRVADHFGNIPSGEATQHICLKILELVPHAIAPFFAHGDPVRNETFVLARSDRRSGQTISDLSHAPLNNRWMFGETTGLRMVQDEPFQIAIPDENGQSIENFINANDLENRKGFTLFPIETTDQNMPLVGALLANPRMVLCGVEHELGINQKPVILIGTIGADTKIAPSLITDALPQPIRRDLQNIADQFTRLGDQNLNTIGHGDQGFWRDSEGKLWWNWS